MEWVFAAATQWFNVQGAIGPPLSPHLGHIWTLSAEVQFYVLWGICLWWMLRRRWPRPVIVGILLMLFVLLWAERALLSEGGASWNRLYLGPDTHGAGLLLGCVLGLTLGRSWRRFKWAIGVLTIPAVAVTLWFVDGLTFLEPRTYRWGLTVVALAWAVVVASAALRVPTPARPLLELPPLVWLGRISYSVYLYHLPIIAEVAKTRPDDPVGVAMVAVPLTLAVGCVSYFLIERPLMSARGRARLRARFAG
jgi:peptidoglycan/LPS O-acetylase OafA/YrhL